METAKWVAVCGNKEDKNDNLLIMYERQIIEGMTRDYKLFVLIRQW